jgi:hypothetical protein
MIIAQRFRALGWVAIVAAAATLLYLISLQVAAERGKLEAVERQIAAAERDMRQLQTELGTRASMRQLEKWNGDVLALSAPKAAQFARDGAQLVALNLDDVGDSPNAAPSMAMAASKAKPPAAVPKPQNANYIKPAESAVPKLQTIAMIQPIAARDVIKLAATEGRKRP